MTKKKKASKDELLIRINELKKENEHLKSLLLTDELTGLYNKRFFFRQLNVETARTKRTGQPCTLIALDLDDFKHINDTLGHYIGDQLLSRFAGTLNKIIRPTDFACRFGGDEFFIIMPSSNLIESLNVAKRIKASLRNADFTPYLTEGTHVSVSIGLAMYEPLQKMTVESFFKMADNNLLAAKKAGKNQIFHEQDTNIRSTVVNNLEREALSTPFEEITNKEQQ